MLKSQILVIILFQSVVIQLINPASCEESEINQRIALLKDAINEFSTKLLKQLNDGQAKNIAFSPLSIVQISSMIISGARGETETELMKVLEHSEGLKTPENVNNAFKLLSDDYDRAKLEQTRKQLKLALTSMALYSNDVTIESDFREHLRKNFKSYISEIDFKGNNEQALASINDFVSKNTNGLIPKLIDSIDENTKLALVSAFYFKGQWIKTFKKIYNRELIFHNADKTTSKVETMFSEKRYAYLDNSDVQVISLPYLGNVSMMILLPRQGKSVDDLIKRLNHTLVDQYRQNLESQKIKRKKVDLYLPKFKIETSTNLIGPMSQMGIKTLFNKNANLTGISSSNKLYCGRAVHKAVLEVNEKGSEAAAATELDIMLSSASPTVEMRVNRPFVYLIYDELNNLILFMGAIKKL